MANLQVTAVLARLCKTVGTAYVGSNPSPATPYETGCELRKRGSEAVLLVDRARCPRGASVRGGMLLICGYALGN
jgi:hypothetical protein